MTSYTAVLGESSVARMVDGKIIYDVPLILTMSAQEYSEFILRSDTGHVRVLIERANV